MVTGYRLVPSSKDIARIKPKNMIQDKERLYEETLGLKQSVNSLREENIKLKTKINNLEREANKFEKMIQEANTNVYKDQPPGKTAEVTLNLLQILIILIESSNTHLKTEHQRS